MMMRQRNCRSSLFVCIQQKADKIYSRSNAQNDALLHRLVHTRILSGSLDPDLNLTSAQRKKALAGRVLEAAGKVKLGKGEGSVRAAERNKAAKRVREGMMVKQKERQQKELEEVGARCLQPLLVTYVVSPRPNN